MDSEHLIRVAVVGAAGRMGQEVLKALTLQDGFEIVVAVDRHSVGINAREIVGPKGPDIVIEERLGAALDRSPADVMVDFSHASAAAPHALSAIKRSVRPVIGATGLSDGDLKEIDLSLRDANLGGIYAPNFAVGAVLMMKFAEIAARWLPDAEIIEMHHEKKEDAPSGTAIRTADLIAEGRTRGACAKPSPQIKVAGARGASHKDVGIHSVRLPGLVAHQMILFGGPGEALTIRHDSMDRASFMQGVKLCVREAQNLSGLVIGMDRLLFPH